MTQNKDIRFTPANLASIDPYTNDGEIQSLELGRSLKKAIRKAGDEDLHMSRSEKRAAYKNLVADIERSDSHSVKYFYGSSMQDAYSSRQNGVREEFSLSSFNRSALVWLVRASGEDLTLSIDDIATAITQSGAESSPFNEVIPGVYVLRSTENSVEVFLLNGEGQNQKFWIKNDQIRAGGNWVAFHPPIPSSAYGNNGNKTVLLYKGSNELPLQQFVLKNHGLPKKNVSFEPLQDGRVIQITIDNNPVSKIYNADSGQWLFDHTKSDDETFYKFGQQTYFVTANGCFDLEGNLIPNLQFYPKTENRTAVVAYKTVDGSIKLLNPNTEAVLLTLPAETNPKIGTADSLAYSYPDNPEYLMPNGDNGKLCSGKNETALLGYQTQHLAGDKIKVSWVELPSGDVLTTYTVKEKPKLNEFAPIPISSGKTEHLEFRGGRFYLTKEHEGSQIILSNGQVLPKNTQAIEGNHYLAIQPESLTIYNSDGKIIGTLKKSTRENFEKSFVFNGEIYLLLSSIGFSYLDMRLCNHKGKEIGKSSAATYSNPVEAVEFDASKGTVRLPRAGLASDDPFVTVQLR